MDQVDLIGAAEPYELKGEGYLYLQSVLWGDATFAYTCITL